VKESRETSVASLRSQGVEVVLDELVQDIDSANVVASKVRHADFDALIINALFYTGGAPLVRFAQEMPDVPLVLWTFMTGPLQLVMFFEATRDLTAIGRIFEPVFGRDQDAMGKLQCYVNAAAVAKKLRMLKIGEIGPIQFVDCYADELALIKKLGIGIPHLDVHDLLIEKERVTEEEAKEAFSYFREMPRACLATLPDFKDVPQVFPTDDILLDAARLSVALERIIARNELGGYSLRSGLSGSALAVSRLSDKGIPGGCEGDLASAITMVILQELTGNPAAMFDFYSGNIESNCLGLWHSGELSTKLAESKAEITITPDPHPGAGGACFRFPAKPGRATLAKLDVDGSKMFVTTGKVARPSMSLASYSEIVLDNNLRDVLRTMAENGIGHHICMVHGDCRPELEALCKILGIEPIMC
jgi:L-fucose isomerase-like protein